MLLLRDFSCTFPIRAAVDTFAETIFPYIPHPSAGLQPGESAPRSSSRRRWSFDVVTEAPGVGIKKGGGGEGGSKSCPIMRGRYRVTRAGFDLATLTIFPTGDTPLFRIAPRES